eukprot:403337761
MFLFSFFSCCDRGIANYYKRTNLDSHPLLEKVQLQVLQIFKKAEAKFGFKNCDIDLFFDQFTEVTKINIANRRELDDLFIDTEDLYNILCEFEDINRGMLRQLLEQDKFYTEGKVGKIRAIKLIMFTIIYCRADNPQKKALKLSLLFNFVHQNDEISGTKKIFNIFQHNFVKKVEKFRNQDEQIAFNLIYELFTTNKVIIQDFTKMISKQYFDKGKKQGFLFKEFMDICQAHQNWILKPHLVREEFLVYALQNKDEALKVMRSGDNKLFSDERQVSFSTSQNYNVSQESQSVMFKFITLKNTQSTPQNINNLDKDQGRRKLLGKKISTYSLQEDLLDEIDENTDSGETISVSISEEVQSRKLELSKSKGNSLFKKQKTKMLLGEQEIYNLVLDNLEQKYGEHQLMLYQQFTKFTIDHDDENKIHKLLYCIRVHQCFTTQISAVKDEMLIDLQQLLQQNLQKNDITQLSKNKISKRKFLYIYQQILSKFENITNSHYFQIKKQANYYECNDLVSGLSMPFRVQFLQSLDELKTAKIKKSEQYMVSFTLYVQNLPVMVCIYPFKNEVYCFSQNDFNDSENIDILKRTLCQNLKDKEIKMQIDNGIMKFQFNQIPCHQ